MTYKKFTDEEIIKALMCHFNEELDEDPFQCVDCPLYNDTSPSCTEALKSYALDLINHQKSEIERLQKEVNLVSIQFQDLQERTNEVKAEAYKEFAEKLKRHIDVGHLISPSKDICFSEVLVVKIVDRVLKEMVGEK